jgi:hypothetical protein
MQGHTHNNSLPGWLWEPMRATLIPSKSRSQHSQRTSHWTPLSRVLPPPCTMKSSKFATPDPLGDSSHIQTTAQPCPVVELRSLLSLSSVNYSFFQRREWSPRAPRNTPSGVPYHIGSLGWNALVNKQQLLHIPTTHSPEQSSSCCVSQTTQPREWFLPPLGYAIWGHLSVHLLLSKSPSARAAQWDGCWWPRL